MADKTSTMVADYLKQNHLHHIGYVTGASNGDTFNTAMHSIKEWRAWDASNNPITIDVTEIAGCGSTITISDGAVNNETIYFSLTGMAV